MIKIIRLLEYELLPNNYDHISYMAIDIAYCISIIIENLHRNIIYRSFMSNNLFLFHAQSDLQ